MFSSLKETSCGFWGNSDKIFGFLLMTFYYNFYSHVNTLMQIESFFIFSLQNVSMHLFFSSCIHQGIGYSAKDML